MAPDIPSFRAGKVTVSTPAVTLNSRKGRLPSRTEEKEQIGHITLFSATATPFLDN